MAAPLSNWDMFAPSIPADAVQSGNFRLVAVESDNMEPTLRARFDYVLCVPVDDYDGEGLYVFNLPGWLAIFRCDCCGPDQIRLLRDNKAYGATPPVTREWFRENVIAKVVADVKVRDTQLLRTACSSAVAS